jgi:hypothetical protein
VLHRIGFDVPDKLVTQPAGKEPIIGPILRGYLGELLLLGVGRNNGLEDPPGLDHLSKSREEAAGLFDYCPDSLGVRRRYILVYLRITTMWLYRYAVVYVRGEGLQGTPEGAFGEA